MTEAAWMACTDPGLMLEFLRGRAGERKLLLFACACCRGLGRDHLLSEQGLSVLQAVERYGAGQGSLLAIRRVLSCNPFARGGYDPVPDRVQPQRAAR